MKARGITRRNALKLAGAAGALAVAGIPTAGIAADDVNEGGLWIGFDLHATGPSATAGTFAMSGRFEDSGASSASPTVTPIPNADHGRLSGDQQFVGQHGTLFTRFEGIAFPNNSPHAVGEGRFQILSGTGAYAGARGSGSFLVIVDAISNQFIGTEKGSVEV